METATTLYLLCGKMAVGKSSLATDLSSKHAATVFREDDLLASLYPGEIVDIPTYANRSNRLKSAIGHTIIQLLMNGASVVMDFPANTRNQRAWLVSLAEQSKASHELYYIDLPDSICKAQLLKRAAENPQRAATDTLEMFDAINHYFEPPLAEERLNIKHVGHRNRGSSHG